MEMTCTWIDCKKEATVPQISKDGQEWSTLCEDHAKEIDKSCDEFLHDPNGLKSNIKKMLSSWIKAQGGAKKAAERI